MKYVLSYLIFYFILTVTTIGNPQNNLISVSNEFISIVVNNQDAIGRFSLETTGGDPAVAVDDNQSLIYGRPIPWTSYTTILIDDIPYIFGAADKRLLRRLQKNVNFGKVLFQNKTSDSIITACLFGDIRVTQTLTFYRNPNTNVKDSALIRYDISNMSDTEAHNVGIRIMLDTKLGQNDGSPLRMGPEAVGEEKLYSKDVLYDYWMTFDNLVSPNIVAQGLLNDSTNQLTFPDSLYLANWGTLVDEPWDIDYQIGRSFIRKGESEKDTALGLYFNPTYLPPNDQHVVQTVYGLGGLTLSPGQIALGLSMPQELPEGFPDTFLIQGYILNTASYPSYDTNINFTLGNGLVSQENNLTSSLDILDVGQQQQVPIIAKLSKSTSAGQIPITLQVNSSTYESNSLTRYINIIPRLKLTFKPHVLEPINASNQQSVIISGEIQNNTSKKITNINTELLLPDGLSFPNIESTVKTIPVLEPNQSETLHWLASINRVEPQYNLNFKTTSPYTNQLITPMLFSLTEYEGFRLIPSKSNIAPFDNFYVALEHFKAINDETLSIRLEFDPTYLVPKRVSPQRSTVDGFIDQTTTTTIGLNSIEVNALKPKQDVNSLLRLAKIHFQAIQSGSSELLLFVNDSFTFAFPIEILSEKKGD